jgi:hypothetical protein
MVWVRKFEGEISKKFTIADLEQFETKTYEEIVDLLKDIPRTDMMHHNHVEEDGDKSNALILDNAIFSATFEEGCDDEKIYGALYVQIVDLFTKVKLYYVRVIPEISTGFDNAKMVKEKRLYARFIVGDLQ